MGKISMMMAGVCAVCVVVSIYNEWYTWAAWMMFLAIGNLILGLTDD